MNSVLLFYFTDGVKKFNLKHLNSDEVKASIQEWDSNIVPPSKPHDEHPQQLFSTPLCKTNFAKHRSVNDPDSRFQLSPKSCQTPQRSSTPLSSRMCIPKENNSVNETDFSGNLFSYQAPVFSPIIAKSSVPLDSKTKNNHSSFGDSSAILNLISCDKVNTDSKLSSLNSYTCKNIFNTANTCKGIANTSNNLTSSSACLKSPQFSLPSENFNLSMNVGQDMFMGLKSIRENDSENIFNATGISSFIQKDNPIIHACIENQKQTCSNFLPKKPRIESQGSCVIPEIENSNRQTYFNGSFLNKLPIGEKYVDHCYNGNFNNSNNNNFLYEQEREDEVSQVDSMLEGLDASSFLDDDF